MWYQIKDQDQDCVAISNGIVCCLLNWISHIANKTYTRICHWLYTHTHESLTIINQTNTTRKRSGECQLKHCSYRIVVNLIAYNHREPINILDDLIVNSCNSKNKSNTQDFVCRAPKNWINNHHVYGHGASRGCCCCCRRHEMSSC